MTDSLLGTWVTTLDRTGKASFPLVPYILSGEGRQETKQREISKLV